MNNLEKIRGSKGLTQTELAAKAGFSRQLLCISEKKNLSVSMAQKIANVLDVNVFEILGADALKILPTTEEEKEILIKTIKEL